MATADGKPQAISQFTDADLEHIRQSTLVELVEFHQDIDSTNDRALELAREPGPRSPSLILAEKQTAGRGRGKNGWWADQGALTFSLLIETAALQLPPHRLPQASLTAGLAVCEAIEELFDEPSIRLKWPNDVYIRMRKVCRILIELPPGRNQMVVGIGINVNNSARHAPRELQASAIALCDVAEREFSMADVLVRVLTRLQERLQWIGRRDEELRSRWRERCLLTGRTVHLDVGTRQIIGQCRGIDDDGALMIETVTQTERCFAGAVTHF